MEGKKVINTHIRGLDNVLEIYHGNELFAPVKDGKNTESFVEDVLFGMGYNWNEDGTISKIEEEK